MEDILGQNIFWHRVLQGRITTKGMTEVDMHGQVFFFKI
jgi:hypothetical protein